MIREFCYPLDGRWVVLTGISLGYGAHGDYLFGWTDGALQRAMDALGTDCFSESCPVLKLQPPADAIACTKPQQAKEEISSDVCMVSSLGTEICVRVGADVQQGSRHFQVRR